MENKKEFTYEDKFILTMSTSPPTQDIKNLFRPVNFSVFI